MTFKYQLYKTRATCVAIGAAALLWGIERFLYDILGCDPGQWQWGLMIAAAVWMIFRGTYKYTCSPFVREGHLDMKKEILHFHKYHIPVEDMTEVILEEKEMLGNVFLVLIVETKDDRYVLRSEDIRDMEPEDHVVWKVYQYLEAEMQYM